MEVKPGYKQSEVGVIPEEWDVSTVGREFEIKLGKMLDAEKNVGVPKPYLGNKAVQWDRIDISDLPTVPMSRTDIEKFRLRKSDLLVCEGGEVGRAAIWEAPIEECYYQKALHRLRPLRGFDSRLMVALLRQWSDRGLLANCVTQTSIAHLPREKLVEVPIPVPTPAEQRAIAAALSDVDALIGALDQLIAKKRDLKQAAMQQLLTGQQRLPGFHREWEVKRLGEIGSFSKGKGIRKDQVVSDGLPCIRYGEIYTQHDDYIRGFYSFISREIAAQSQRLRKGDLLFAGSGETAEEIGKCVSFLGDEEAYAGGDIVVFSPVDQDSMYLGYLMNHASVSCQKARMGQGDAVVHISARNLALLDLRLPKVEEQTAIATVLSDMDAEIAALEARRDKTRALKQGMTQELLTGRIRLL
ncbi:MAG: restriction endonuclease subunit S [Candidatus Binatia bacterium]